MTLLNFYASDCDNYCFVITNIMVYVFLEITGNGSQRNYTELS